MKEKFSGSSVTTPAGHSTAIYPISMCLLTAALILAVLFATWVLGVPVSIG